MGETNVTQLDYSEIAHRLEDWYGKCQRDLPWRSVKGRGKAGRLKRGYFALVSEAMLQQTQVSRVVERFGEFVKRYPNINALAKADEQDVLALWQGLGYYRRARNLHGAAKVIVKRYGGVVPDDIEALMSLPGVGRYTAGAIASIAFGKREPVVDGNVKRVVARLTGYGGSTEDRVGEQFIWKRAGELVAKSELPGEFNQALMELGSLVCLPAGSCADCERCPVRGLCGAYRLGLVGEIPIAKKAPVQKDLFAASVVIRNGRGKWLMVKRPRLGLWGSMWEVPTLERERKSHINRGAVEQFIEREVGYHIANNISNKSDTVLTQLNSFLHQTSHRRISFTVWELNQFRGRKKVGKWLSEKDIKTHPISNAQRKVLGIM